MAKLSDLRKLVHAARVKAPAPQPARATQVSAARPIAKSAAPPIPQKAPASPRHADGDIDLAHAFADVRKLAPGTRVKHAPSRPAPIPKQRIADDADALLASKYGAEPTPETWEVGQEHEAGQTFLRRARSICTATRSTKRTMRWPISSTMRAGTVTAACA